MNSAALPNVTFNSPPMAGPARSATCSVARRIQVLSGMIAAAPAANTHIGAADVREHLASALHRRYHSYDIADAGLVVWPEPDFEAEITYPFSDTRTLTPRPARLAERYQLPRIETDDLFFVRNPVRWADWVEVWSPQTTTGEWQVAARLPNVLPKGR